MDLPVFYLPTSSSVSNVDLAGIKLKRQNAVLAVEVLYCANTVTVMAKWFKVDHKFD